MSNPFDDAVMELLTGKSTSAPPEPVDGNQLLRDISGFIGRYLYCSQHQRTILALWVLHTYCYRDARLTPYLSIQSAEKQSGKTLCLQLLQLLCDFATLTAGVTASSLRRLMEGVTPTVLLDECQASVGTRSRSKAPTLRAMLVRGTHPDPDGIAMIRDCKTFGPKAFAGRGQLPEDLADYSIPIILEPLKNQIALPTQSAGMSTNHEAIDDEETVFRSPDHRGPQHAQPLFCACSGGDHPITEPVLEASLRSRRNHPMIYRFHLRSVAEEAKPLRKQLRDWHTLHRAALGEMPSCLDEQFPPGLSYRQQDLCEPLLHLAQLIGGDWPARIREALINVFEEQTKFDLQASIQLLADIRDCFAYHGYPQRLSTANLVEWIHSLPARPWDVDGRFSAHTLARLLGAFEIRPRNQRIDQAGPRRGYQLEDFREPWETHLHFVLPQSEIANNDKGCNGVSLAHTGLVPAHSGAPEAGGEAIELDRARSPQLVEDRHEMEAQEPPLSTSEIANRSNACNTLAQMEAEPGLNLNPGDFETRLQELRQKTAEINRRLAAIAASA